ncbi:MAG: class D sortase [Clostridiales bacterium]|jgi:sortase A|nr:class D sortase [Clostridiales bacterium]
MKPKAVLMAIMMVIAFVLGAWLLLTPTLERQYALDKQVELLESIEAGDDEVDGEPVISPAFVTEAPPIIIDEPTIQPTTEPLSSLSPEPTMKPELFLLAASWDDPIFTTAPVPLADTEFPDDIIGLGILTIEKINLRLPVAEGISEAGLKIAVGHVPDTTAVGEIGNAVIAGHRSYIYGQFFNRLDEISIGDIIVYQAKSGEIMEFIVFEIAVIHPGDQIAFIQPSDKSVITLYTCTPVRIATHRLIVRAKKL